MEWPGVHAADLIAGHGDDARCAGLLVAHFDDFRAAKGVRACRSRSLCGISFSMVNSPTRRMASLSRGFERIAVPLLQARVHPRQSHLTPRLTPRDRHADFTGNDVDRLAAQQAEYHAALSPGRQALDFIGGATGCVGTFFSIKSSFSRQLLYSKSVSRKIRAEARSI
ncbi:hypothetical protein AB4Y42_36980 [Paraburkholderia sp. EG286B]|uniref:hypothetical protein n=1 Tax=Paraburkholderia sp. EG286B TaxID=3237011 RepID=UPI0034D15D2F